MWWSKGKAREDADNAAFRDWRLSMAQFLAEAKEMPYNEKTHQRCLLQLEEQSTKSPLIRFLARHLAMLDPVFEEPESSPTIQLPIAVHCMPCKRRIASAHTDGGIVICENNIFSFAHARESLAKEMLLEWDVRRFKVDGTNLRHHACTMIRASALSGDCHFGREMTRSLKSDERSFARGHPRCVRRQAIAAVEMNDNCESRQQAETVVDEVFDSCYADTRPFDEIYTGP